MVHQAVHRQGANALHAVQTASRSARNDGVVRFSDRFISPLQILKSGSAGALEKLRIAADVVRWQVFQQIDLVLRPAERQETVGLRSKPMLDERQVAGVVARVKLLNPLMRGVTRIIPPDERVAGYLEPTKLW